MVHVQLLFIIQGYMQRPIVTASSMYLSEIIQIVVLIICLINISLITKTMTIIDVAIQAKTSLVYGLHL